MTTGRAEPARASTQCAAVLPGQAASSPTPARR